MSSMSRVIVTPHVHEQHESRDSNCSTVLCSKEGVAEDWHGYVNCFEPLGLAASIHEDLPFLMDLGNSHQLLSNTTFVSVINEGVGEAIDSFLVSIVYLPCIENFGYPFEAYTVA